MTVRDPGLQPERTALAWQRSALALAVATIVVGRLTFEAAGALALIVVFLGLAHTAALFVLSRTGRPRAVAVHGVLLSVQVAALAILEILALLRS
jgi:putative membrane protein